MNNRVVSISLSILVCSMALAGCGKDGPQTYSVSGTVTIGGKPMERGRIQFAPDPAKGNEGPIAAAVIIDGHYDTSATDQGVVGGPHLVIIRSGATSKTDQPSAGNERKIDYHTTIDLPKDSCVQDFEVPAS